MCSVRFALLIVELMEIRACLCLKKLNAISGIAAFQSRQVPCVGALAYSGRPSSNLLPLMPFPLFYQL